MNAEPLELTDSGMSERQRGYRATYRERVAGWYNGWLHVFIIYTIGLTALYIYISNMQSISLLEWLTVPLTFLMCNFFEWWLHRYIMHRPSKVPLFRAVYSRHTLMHHQFFTDTEMRFAGQHDFRVTFFPPITTTTSMYLIYEFMHFCCHIDENWFVRNAPFINTIRRHHTAHHNQNIMMERNMNLTFPVMDWLFGTSDLNRGLLGHVFNGYDTAHVKTDMRKTSATPKVRRPATGPAVHPAE
jgi:hypothetical protein